MSKVMIDNRSSFSDDEVMNYLAGYTTKLNDKIEVLRTEGEYYNNIVVRDVKINPVDNQ